MTDIVFEVPGKPVAQPRQRFMIMWPALAAFPWALSPRDFLKWLKSHAQVHNYTPADHPVTTYKQAVTLMARHAHDGNRIEGPVMLWVTFVMPRTSDITWKTKPMPRRWHVKKPDSDNLEKAVKDAITAAGVWKDDSQVCWTNKQKIIASGDEEPRTIIRIAVTGDIAPDSSSQVLEKKQEELLFSPLGDDDDG